MQESLPIRAIILFSEMVKLPPISYVSYKYVTSKLHAIYVIMHPISKEVFQK